MNFLYRSFFPLIFLIVVPLGLMFSKKFRLGFRIRKQRLKPSLMPKLQSSFWIHAASGEYEYARPLIVELKKQFPETPVVVTFFSPTYSGIIDKDPLVDHSLPLPFDLPGPIKSFIKRINPKALFIARTDLWPEVLCQCRLLNVSSVLFSYHQNDSKNYVANLWQRWLLKKITHIDCVNDKSASALKNIGLTSVSSFGDTRYDRVIERKNHPKTIPFEIPQERVVVLGSTWKEDEEVVLPTLAKTSDLWDLVIIAPHEPTSSHLQSLQKQLDLLGLDHELFSIAKNSTTKKVLLVDQVGWLFDLYRFGELAFVGGSFKSSVHSVMEPLAHGLRVFLGPKIQNNGEALEFSRLSFKQKAILKVCHSSLDAESFISEHFSSAKSIRAEIKTKIQNEIVNRSGTSRKLLNHVLKVHG